MSKKELAYKMYKNIVNNKYKYACIIVCFIINLFSKEKAYCKTVYESIENELKAVKKATRKRKPRKTKGA